MADAAEPARIRDVLSVREHPTVVRLAELAQDGGGWIRESFHITPDVERHLTALAAAFKAPAGVGAFVVGQYGSGKSHFLAYVTQALAAGAMEGPAPVPISLVHFPADQRLEAIVGRELGLPASPSDRRPVWAEALKKSPRGLCLVLDELSEFLGSKPPRDLQEDLRFLHFLGEHAAGSRLYVLAAAQEEIEHLGSLEYGLYRKIKDRFPLRLILSPAHVKDIVAGSILQKSEGYEDAVARLVARLREALGDQALDFRAVADLYPVHPMTLDLLEAVRDSFSQARGVVDLVVSQLRGDPRRHIAPFLDAPFGSFLTPDVIVDHFRDLLLLQPEFVPLAQQVLPFLDGELPKLFDKPAERDFARSERPDAILLDVMMPEMDGPTTLKRLRSDPTTARIPIIFLTAKVQPAERRRLAEMDVASVIASPSMPPALRASSRARQAGIPQGART